MHSPVNATKEEVKKFWEDWINQYNPESFSDDKLFLERSVYDLMKVAIENEQYQIAEEFLEVKRVVKFRISMPRCAMKQTLGIDTWSIYGLGLFTVVEGIFISSSSRQKSGYDTVGSKRFFDLSFVPEDIREKYEFSLATPALGGLFVPKKSNLTRWMSRVNQIQYFDLSI